MDTKIPLHLDPVEETCLITLYGRAAETANPDGLLRDPAAVRMVESIDYDFSLFAKAPTWVANLRTLLYDHVLRSLLAENPDATVVELGGGLNTRFERVDNGRLHWVDLDLPGATALRRRFFEDQERRTMVGASVLDDAWCDQVSRLPSPTFFVAEGLLPYLTENQVRELVSRLAERYPGCLLLTDVVPNKTLTEQDPKGPLKDMAASKMWSTDDPHDVEGFAPDVRLCRTASMRELLAEHAEGVQDLPPHRREAFAFYEDRRVYLYRLGLSRSPEDSGTS